MKDIALNNSEKPTWRRMKPNWFKVFLCISAFVFSFLIIGSMLLKGCRPADATEATNNAKQIGLALFEFDSIYGSYPNEFTLAEVNRQHPRHGFDLSGSSANSIFRQLFACGIVQNERMFQARVQGSNRADNNIFFQNLLLKGEVGFSYISGLSSKDDPLTPILISPLITGTTKFDPKPFNGRAIILRIDQSVEFYKIEADGHVYENGIDILSSHHPIWKGKTPNIRYPELINKDRSFRWFALFMSMPVPCFIY